MCIGFHIVRDTAQLPNKVETGSIAHFDCTVCDDDDHFISPISTDAPAVFYLNSGAD